MAAIKEFFPATGSEAEWNAAYYRLEDYLRALRVVNKVHQSQVVLRLLEAAAARHLLEPESNPTTLAMEETRREMERWFSGVFSEEESTVTSGLISFAALDATEKWPAAFLAEEVPFEFEKAMLEGNVHAMKDLQISSMVPRPLDLFSPIEAVATPDPLGNRDRRLALAGATVVAAIALAVYFFFFR